jgi:hypothetical protein
LRPGGSGFEVEVNAHLYGACPPLTVSVAEYFALLTEYRVPAGSFVVVIAISRQAALLVEPVCSVNVPVGHLAAEIAPTVATYVFSGASRHLDAPAVEV